MSRSSEQVPGLRVESPTREPDPVLLAQLVELSAASSRGARGPRALPRILLAAASIVAVASVSWVAGAVPGTRSPLEPANKPTPSVSPGPSPSQSGSGTAPGAPAPTPGASDSPTGGRSWPAGRATDPASSSPPDTGTTTPETATPPGRPSHAPTGSSAGTPAGSQSGTPSGTPPTSPGSLGSSPSTPPGQLTNPGRHTGQGHPHPSHPAHPTSSARLLPLPGLTTPAEERMHPR